MRYVVLVEEWTQYKGYQVWRKDEQVQWKGRRDMFVAQPSNSLR